MKNFIYVQSTPLHAVHAVVRMFLYTLELEQRRKIHQFNSSCESKIRCGCGWFTSCLANAAEDHIQYNVIFVCTRRWSSELYTYTGVLLYSQKLAAWQRVARLKPRCTSRWRIVWNWVPMVGFLSGQSPPGLLQPFYLFVPQRVWVPAWRVG